MFELLQEWDKDTFVYLNSLGIEEYDSFWTTVTSFTTWIPLFIFIIFLINWKYTFKQSLWILFYYTLLISTVTVFIFLAKQGIGRLRPNNNEAINSLIRILQNPSDYSFFSGHAAASFSIATMTVLYLKSKVRWIPLLFLWPILFSMSRIYVGVHYPLDILVGAVVGLLMALLFYRIHQRFNAPYSG